MTPTAKGTNAGVPRHVPAATSSGRGAQTPDFSRFQAGSSGATGVQRPSGGISMPPMATSTPPATPIPDDFDDLLDLSGSDLADAPKESRALRKSRPRQFQLHRSRRRLSRPDLRHLPRRHARKR
ncbi:hypothetical protein ACERZ8_21570 [Tateyamaria armeniaca]|uniref:Uncharacterized protein n=1 Tax=Tateyamaria armeniaca TaxID=2518930 RepID=A0ABW8UYV4_9RHOB